MAFGVHRCLTSSRVIRIEFVEPAGDDQDLGVGAFGLGDFNGQIARLRVVGNFIHDLIRHVEFRHDRADPLGHCGAERVVDMHVDGGLRCVADEREDFLLIGERVGQDRGGDREVSEHEFVALLGDLRRRRDVDHEGDAFLLGHLRDRGGLSRIERADQELRAVPDQFLGAGTRRVDVRLGVAVHDVEIGQTK